MELKPLKSFIAVATLKSFSAAARELHTVQPAISRHIAALEKELGTLLFIRNTRDVHITAAGRQLFTDAARILQQAEEAVLRTQKAANGELGSLKVGYLPSACLTFIPDLVQRFHSQYPDVEISLFEMTASEQLLAFETNHIDIGISRPLPPELQTTFTSQLLYTDQLTLVLPSQHALAQRQSIRLDDLRQEHIILFQREEAVGLFDSIINLCQRHHFSPHISAQPKHMQTVLTMVAAGLGVAIAPLCVSKLFTQGCRFMPIEDDHTQVLTQMHYRSSRLAPTAQAFVNIASESVPWIQNSVQA
ncbi:LysR family transcriptional regulator [Oceanobacter sp. 4_MG-2023]|uniref:LysR family transcriptional regulator n=1 Tax=Oceanobacter sp. 4_MG-2023 TaxID=3062623 RepID=UPI0027346618|nr:LysR family transcriptional regulator [Oceanobacter sp. 4_MG-2023]MDP2547551.1 LysR substrate-binding domain-containing protein [Oceanobacter sp. 4_MG-2023]